MPRRVNSGLTPRTGDVTEAGVAKGPIDAAECRRRLCRLRPGRAIARAARDAERDPADITLVAVSKTFPAEAIVPVLAAGPARLRREPRAGGEGEVAGACASAIHGVELHLIGPLQTNKAREAVALFDVIETRRPRLARRRRSAKEIGQAGPRAAAAGPGQHRRGAAEGRRHRRGDADAFIAGCRDALGPRHRRPDVHPAGRRAALAAFRACSPRSRARHGLELLSMGMSADFEAAIQLGATHVRVGSAIFGARGIAGPAL